MHAHPGIVRDRSSQVRRRQVRDRGEADDLLVRILDALLVALLIAPLFLA